MISEFFIFFFLKKRALDWTFFKLELTYYFTLALKFASKRILEDFRSLCITDGLQCSCKYSNALVNSFQVSEKHKEEAQKKEGIVIKDNSISIMTLLFNNFF